MICNQNEAIRLEPIFGEYNYILLEPLNYNVNNEVITVPSGFITDGNTLPRFLWSIYPPLNKALRAAILHDYMYDNAIMTKAIADDAYKKVCRECGVNKRMMYIALFFIHFFGKGTY
ncbi:DUF1353 domain-containing protein [Orbus wheelerorum]|uniref:DUF1353 domain-containing protein n=1 Tax=Orbus wheelerorum TaxID=3074111 RepID=UPI00370D1E05